MVSLLWICVNLGSKYWQAYWESQCSKLEKQIDESIKLFDTCRDDTDCDVKKSLQLSEIGKFKRAIYKFVPWRPSVSFMMILLSIVFFVMWLVLLCASIISIWCQ